MWDLPGPGIRPTSPALTGGFLTTRPPGKPCILFFLKHLWFHVALKERYHLRYSFQTTEPFPTSEPLLFSLPRMLLPPPLWKAGSGHFSNIRKTPLSCLPFPTSHWYLHVYFLLGTFHSLYWFQSTFLSSTDWFTFCLLQEHKLQESRHYGCLVFHCIPTDFCNGQDTGLNQLNNFQRTSWWTSG